MVIYFFLLFPDQLRNWCLSSRSGAIPKYLENGKI